MVNFPAVDLHHLHQLVNLIRTHGQEQVWMVQVQVTLHLEILVLQMTGREVQVQVE